MLNQASRTCQLSPSRRIFGGPLCVAFSQQSSPDSQASRRPCKPRTGRRNRSPSWCRSAPAARPISWRASSPRTCRRSSARPSWSRTAPAPAAASAPTTVAKAAPDGYTLLLGTVSSIAVNAALYAKLPFDVDKDLQPITQLVSFPNLLIVNPKLPVNNVQELIDYVKKNDGKVNYASSGLGTSSHLSVVMFEQAIGTKMTHVPYKSTGDVVNSMLGGNVDIAIDSMTTVWPHAKQGTVRALGVSRRSAAPRRPRCRRSARPSKASRRPPGRGCSRRPARRSRSSRRSRPRPGASGVCRR